VTLPAAPPTRGLPTVAEASGFERTSLHDDVRTFLAKLSPRTDRMAVLSMGKSGLGQDMPVAVLSASGAFTPAAAAATGRPVVLVIANIHAGEVEGKEATLALARETTLGDLSRLIERATVLLIPDYNPDGNDRIDVANRALDLARLEGQIGPVGGVGTRYTGKGINLNRDYTKQEAVETRNLAALMAAWRPHVVVDCHTTDGSVHGYELTFDTSRNLDSCPLGPAVFTRDMLLPEVSAALRERTGFRTWFYGNFREQDDPTSGWESYPPLPRYGSHYRGLLGVVDVLLEAYSYVDFRTRFLVTYEILVELLDAVARRGPEVVGFVRAAQEAVERGRGGDAVGIDYGVPVRGADGRVSFRHVGKPLYRTEIEGWDLPSHRARRIPGVARTTYRNEFLGLYPPTVTVRAPAAYVVPAAERLVVEALAGHRLAFERVGARGIRAPIEAYRVVSTEPTASPDVGDHVLEETVLRVESFADPRPTSPDDVLVPTTQPWGRLATYLLEPHSDDGLARWGAFPAVRAGDVFPVRRVLR
jgi:hypothetical protein